MAHTRGISRWSDPRTIRDPARKTSPPHAPPNQPNLGERAAVDTSLALRVYHRYYNLVDRLNKKIAAMNMGMARCKKRYQRQLYIGWLLPAVARNVNVLFQCLWPEMAALRAATCSWRTCSR